MGLHTPPLWIQAGSYAAQDDRQLLASIVYRSGIVKSTDFVVTQTTTASMSVNISGGRAFIIGGTITGQGAYDVYSDGPESRTITAANSSNPRIDIVVLTIRDAAVSGSNNDVILQVVAGTPNGSPTAPATPADSLLLATIAVGAGVTNITNANITAVAVQTALINTTIPVKSQAERDALTQTPGLRVFRGDTGATETSNGTLWNSDAPVYSARVQSAGKSIPDSVFTLLDNWTNVVQSATGISYALGIWTIGIAGYYQIVGQVGFGPVGSPAGQRAARLFVNGAIVDEFGGARPDTTYNTTLPLKYGYVAAVGDQISIQVYQSQGSSQSTVASASICHMSIHRTGRA